MALSIKEKDNRWRIDLFSIDDIQRLHCGSSFDIPIEINPGYCT